VSFSPRDLHPGLDVFSADNVYLGTVVKVRWEGGGWLRGPSAQPAPATAPSRPLIAGFSGERLGPMPTSGIGNGGPSAQSVSARYASETHEPPWSAPPRPAELLIFRCLVSLTWKTARPVLRRIPAELVQLISLERVVLSATAADID
jgi:hypothetical protein